jgi:hypothetical protein
MSIRRQRNKEKFSQAGAGAFASLEVARHGDMTIFARGKGALTNAIIRFSPIRQILEISWNIGVPKHSELEPDY